VTGYPGWEGTFLGRALDANENIAVTRLEYAAGRPLLGKHFPMSATELDDYDALILMTPWTCSLWRAGRICGGLGQERRCVFLWIGTASSAGG